jgi:hypothetical protein
MAKKRLSGKDLTNAKLNKSISLKPAAQVSDPQPKLVVDNKANAELKLLRARITQDVEEEIKALGIRSCACGCGGTTRNTFLPGHDAKLKSRMLKERLEQATQEKVEQSLIRAPRAARRSA